MKVGQDVKLPRKLTHRSSSILSNDFGVTIAVNIVVEDNIVKYFVAKCDTVVGFVLSNFQLVYWKEMGDDLEVNPVVVSSNQRFVVKRPDRTVERVLVNADGEIVT